MTDLDLPPEDLEKLRLTEPLACAVCRVEDQRQNYRLTVSGGAASGGQPGAVLRCSAGHVFRAVFVPLDGLVYFATVAARPAGDRRSGRAVGGATVSETGRHPLSDDDVTVVILLCEGLTNGEIAARLEIGEHVVSRHVARILQRLGLRNRIQLAVWAVKQGLY